MNSTTAQPTARVSIPNILLRLEGLTVLVATIILYAHLRGNTWLFAALFLVPDVGMIGYLRNPQLGSMTYNAVHTYALPTLLLGAGAATNIPIVIYISLIWFAHIGFDRIMGYGLKYPNAFKDTHMQHV